MNRFSALFIIFITTIAVGWALSFDVNMVKPGVNPAVREDAEETILKDVPVRATLEGQWECLPHVNTEGPQTMECAFGLAVISEGVIKHYAIDLNLLEIYPVDFPTGTNLRVDGVLVPKAQLSTDHWEKYPIEGILSATSITEI